MSHHTHSSLDKNKLLRFQGMMDHSPVQPLYIRELAAAPYYWWDGQLQPRQETRFLAHLFLWLRNTGLTLVVKAVFIRTRYIKTCGQGGSLTG